MNVLKLRWWHWTMIGLFLGVVLGGMRVFWGPSYLDSTARTLSRELFEAAVLGKSEGEHTLVLMDLLVHPADRSGREWVTGRFVERKLYTPAEGPPQHLRFEGSFKYPGRGSGAGTGTGQSVRAFLRDAARQRPEIHYRYGWHEREAAMFWLCVGVTVVAVGGIWPILLWLLVRAGLAASANDTGIAIQFGGRGSRHASEDASSVDTERAQEQTEELIATMQSQATEDGNEPAVEAGVRSSGDKVRRLDAGPQVAAAVDEPESQRDYGGEFYPTEVHVAPRPSGDEADRKS